LRWWRQAEGREDQARKLLHWGQQNFDTVQILHNGKKVGTERIWYGDKEQVKLGTDQDFWLAESGRCPTSKPNTCWIKKSWKRRLPRISVSGRSAL
jgi:D-alanyl-D-alanine carboxypeptidase